MPINLLPCDMVSLSNIAHTGNETDCTNSTDECLMMEDSVSCTDEQCNKSLQQLINTLKQQMNAMTDELSTVNSQIILWGNHYTRRIHYYATTTEARTGLNPFKMRTPKLIFNRHSSILWCSR